MRATVIGAGAFGTAIANTLVENCDQVWLWAREPDLVQTLNSRHENTLYLPGIPLSPKVRATGSMEEALKGAELVVSATPSHATRAVMSAAAPHLPQRTPIVSITKGIENDSLHTTHELLEDCLPEDYHPYLAVLSGPSFAKEVAQRMPTVVTIAAHWPKIAQRCQKVFQTEFFRSYTSSDVMGAEMGGALKNVIAIATGIADGLGFGHNARSGIITRGLAEITRIAVRRGANPLTLSGLSGMGDLVLTCTGDLSRNRRVGLALGQGRSLDEILGQMKEVAEGVKTAKSARDLARRYSVELPICEQVYCILFEGKSPKAAVYELMTRQAKPEL